jgi:methylornithine synthase
MEHNPTPTLDMNKTEYKLETILSKPRRGDKLSIKDITFLLNLSDPGQIDAVLRTAADLRRRYFDDKIFFYGFLNISTYCRNDCRFCFYRRSNPKSRRYRKEFPEIVSAAAGLAGSGIHLLDLTMGEDPALFNGDGAGYDRLVALVNSVRQTTGLPIMVSPGVIPASVLCQLAEAGADWYACYQETHQRGLFARLRPGQDFDHRLQAKHKARSHGLLIEEGLLCGVGETAVDLADSIEVMRHLDADQVRVMKFVPQPGTPMAKTIPADSCREMLIMAVLRLVFPDRLIPASLDVDGLRGLKQRLEAGANVITSIVPPGSGLAGVAQHSLDIEDGRRTMPAVLKVLKDSGLRPAGEDAYRSWINDRQRAIGAGRLKRKVACESV